MQENLINILEGSINCLGENIKAMSVDLRYLKRTYDQLIPNKKRRQNIKVRNMDEEAFCLFMEVLEYNNRVLFNKIMQLDEEGKKLDLEHEKNIKSPLNNMDDFARVKWNVAFSIKEDKFYEKASEIYAHACTYYVELYESIEKEKEDTKDTKKNYEYALKNIKSNIPLMTRDISTITNLINELDIEDEDRKILFDELNDYIVKTKKEKIISVPPKEVIEEKKVIYTDYEIKEEYIEEEQEDIFSYNYLVTLKSFSSFNDINIFLNSIKFSCDITRLVENVINLLGDFKEDNLLKEYLMLYLSKQEQEEIKEEKKDNIIFYYGFYDEKSKIISDIEKTDIPKEYYSHIKEALDMIKHGKDKRKFKRINSVSKVLKLRYKDIRITYKKLSNNIYIILGIFCKKDRKGNNIISTTKDRYAYFLKNEKSILESVNIPELWEEYIKENSKVEEEIKRLLVSYTK